MTDAPTVCILAAGLGSRLGPATATIPKSLVDVAGLTILGRQLETIRRCGIPDSSVRIVTGYQAGAIIESVGSQIQIIHNVYYAQSNNIYSVHLLSHRVGDDMLLINGDTLFHQDLLAGLLKSQQHATLVVDTLKNLSDEEMKTLYEDGRLRQIGKNLDPSQSSGEYIGLLRLRGRCLHSYFREIARMVRNGKTDRWYEDALNGVADRMEIGLTPTNGLPWIEIDTPEDIDLAVTLVLQME